MNVQQAGYTAEFQSRTEQSYQTGGSTSTAPQSSGTSSSGKTVTFGKPFFTGTSGLGGVNAFLPSVGITITDAEAGDFFALSNITGTGNKGRTRKQRGRFNNLSFYSWKILRSDA